MSGTAATGVQSAPAYTGRSSRALSRLLGAYRSQPARPRAVRAVLHLSIRLLTPVAHIEEGLHWRYPLCCVLRFAWTSVRWPMTPQAWERGIAVLAHPRPDDEGLTYVPCNVFHHGWSWDAWNPER